MSDATTQSATHARARRSRPYLRLLWLIPALAMLGAGLYRQFNVEPGGEVTAIKLTTKTGMVGQAAEVMANLKSSPDLYVRVITPAQPIELPVFKDTPIGNGLTWNLPAPLALHDVQRIDVFDRNRVFKDDQLDRITIAGWATDGQLFHVDLLGIPNTPPQWALPVASVGGVIALWVLLRFVWDQVI